MGYLKHFRIIIVFTIVLIALFTHPMDATAAEAPYTTWTRDKDGNLVFTQDGYLPAVAYDKFGEELLSKPSDLFLSKSGKLYIADSGNKRIVIVDLKGNLLGIVEDPQLKSPTGIFVDDNDTLYVADPKLAKILLFSKDGEFLKEYASPVSPLFAQGSRYAPTKLVVNKAGGIYALSEGNANGILTFSQQGDFYGYFGANNTRVSFTQIIRRYAFTDEMRSYFKENVPAAACNIDIDKNGLIYTVTQGTREFGDGLKKFNMAGKNMLDNNYIDRSVVDVAVGDIENIFTLSNRFITEYTRDQEIIFDFGIADDGRNRLGLFVNPVAIEVDREGNLYVLDYEKGSITVFNQTEYARTVHEAINLYQEGFYVESHAPWNEVLRKNSIFDYANRGISKAYYRLEQYDETLKYARLGGDREGYSDAFWELRNDWLRNNIIKLFFLLIGLVITRRLINRFKDKAPGLRSITRGIRHIKSRKLVKELLFMKYIPKNPSDAFYGIKWEGKVSVLSSTVTYFIFFFIYLINKYYSGFLFKTVQDGTYDLTGDILLVFGVIMLIIVCNNLICSIHDGEGSMKNIYCAFAYCLMPYIFFKPLVIILTQVLSLNESFIISFMNFMIFSGIAVLVIVMIKDIQAYTFRQTFRCIFLTIFTMLVLLAAGIVMVALISQVYDFIVSIIKEGYYRGR